MTNNSRQYYEQRIAKERELAAAAVDPVVAAIHLELAAFYEALTSGRPLSDNPDRAPITDQSALTEQPPTFTH